MPGLMILVYLYIGPAHQDPSRSSPYRAGTSKRGLSVQDSADRIGSRKRQVLDATQVDSEVASEAQQAASSAQPNSAVEKDIGKVVTATASVSKDTHSDGAALGPVQMNGAHQADAEGSRVDENLVSKLAANLQMALKALSILKGVESTVFEDLQPADLANLDLHTLCETPSPTPSQ